MEQASLKDEFSPLDPEEIRISRDRFGDLQVRVNGDTYDQIEVSRAFPYSDKDKYIILESDGEEIGIIEDVTNLDSKEEDLITEELEKTYFIPEITRVKDIEVSFRKPTWYVETDRGERSFEVGSRRDINFVAPNRIVVKDANGNKYEISDYSSLDPESRELVEREAT